MMQRVPSRSIFMGSGSFSAQSPRLGQFDWVPSVITGLLQAAPAAVSAYAAKRAADVAKLQKSRDATKAAADTASAAKTAAEEKVKADALLQAQQGVTSVGVSGQKILGVDPIVFLVGGIGIIGVGAVLFISLKKKK
jgi:hypothetical protein